MLHHGPGSVLVWLKTSRQPFKALGWLAGVHVLQLKAVTVDTLSLE